MQMCIRDSHCTHHNIFSCHEGKLIHYTGMDYLIIDNQSVTYIEQNSQNGIHSQEGFRYRDPPVGNVYKRQASLMKFIETNVFTTLS